MMKKKLFAALAAALCSVAVWAAVSEPISSGPIVPGEWNSNYRQAQKYAEDNNLPFIAIVSKQPAQCHYCALFHDKWCDDTFVEWAKSFGAIMGAFYDNAPYDHDRSWVDWVRGSNTGYPMMRLYWKKKDGKVVSDQFMGRAASLGDVDGDKIKGTQKDLFARIERAFEGWSPVPPFAGGTFVSEAPRELYFSNQDTREEATLVYAVSRAAETATNQMVVVSFPGSKLPSTTNSFSWAQGALETEISVSIPRAAYEPGKTAVIDLLDGEGGSMSSVTVSFVEAPYLGGVFNASALSAVMGTKSGAVVLTRTLTDPFTQELVYSYKALPAGDVTNKIVKIDWKDTTEQTVELDFSDLAEGPVSLALMDGPVTSGTLAIEMLAEDKPNSSANPYFVGEKTADELQWGEWTMDVDVAQAKAAAEGGQVLFVTDGSLWCGDCTKAEANFFSKDGFKKWAVSNKVVLVQIDLPRRGYDCPTLLNPIATNGASGSEYLFRKGASAGAAKAVYERNRKYAWEDWRLPTSIRVGTPTFLKLGSDGKVAGRITDFAIRGPTSFKDEYLTRLDELLAVEDHEEANGDISTTSDWIRLGRGADGEVSSVDRCDIVKVVATASGDAIFSLKGPEAGTANVTLSILSTNATVLASKTGTLDEQGLSVVVPNLVKGEYFVKIEGDSKNGFEFDKAGSSLVAWTLATSKILIPDYTSASDDAIGKTVVMRLLPGEDYKIEGLDFAQLEATGLEALDAEGRGPYYRSTRGGDITLPVLYADGTVTYCRWKPGTLGFKAATMKVFEFGGTGVVSVVRAEGGSGSITVDVKKISGDDRVPGRYVWKDTVLMWDDGEMGEKTIEFTLNDDHAFEEQEKFEIQLVAEGYLGKILTDKMTITVSDTDKPCFDSLQYNYTLPVFFATAQTTPVFNVDYAKSVSLVRKAGALPTGVTLRYDRTTGSVLVSGTPTKVGTFSATYILKQGAVQGIETTFNFTVFSPAEPVEGAATPVNEFVGKAFDAVIPLTEGTHLVGELTVAVTSRNKISAKYRGDSSSKVSFSGSWQDISADGTCSAVLNGAKGRSLNLCLAADGTVSAELAGVDNELAGEAEVLSGTAPVREKGDDMYAAFKGYYTLTVPVVKAGDSKTPNTGTGYLMLTMTSKSALKNGTAKYAGRHANGTAFSGTLSLVPADKGAMVTPLFSRTAKDLLSAMVRICPDAASTCDVEDTLQVIRSTRDYKAVNRHAEAAYAYLNEVEIFGGYYTKNRTPQEICNTYETYEGSYAFEVKVNGQKVADATAEVTKFVVSNVLIDRLTLNFAKGTGVISGAAKMQQTDGSVVSGTWYGVLMPGWTICGECGMDETLVERPFGSGTFYWTQKVDGKNVKMSVPVDLEHVVGD